jgi:hypothetical protein
MSQKVIDLSLFLHELMTFCRDHDNAYADKTWIFAPNGQHLSEKLMQRNWKRALAKGYCTISAEYSHPFKYGAGAPKLRRKYKLNTAKIIQDFGMPDVDYINSLRANKPSLTPKDIEIDEELERLDPNHLLRVPQKRINEVNPRLPPITKIRMNVRAKEKNGKSYVTGRYSSTLCGMKTDIRPAFLNTLNKYDVEASILSCNLLLRTGEWADDDLKKIIMMEAVKIDPSVANLTKDDIKHICFRCSFGGSEKLEWSRTKREWTLDKKEERYTQEQFGAVFRSARKICGETLGPEIFIHESYIYISVIEALSLKGYFGGFVYDCFYSDQSIGFMKAVVKAAALDYYENYYSQGLFPGDPRGEEVLARAEHCFKRRSQ